MTVVNWDAVSASAEVIGVVAVLASILYLARQVTQGNKLNQSDSVRTFLGEYNGFIFQINEPEMIEIWRRGTTDFESLTDHEKSRLHFVLLGQFMLGQAQRMVDPEGAEELSRLVDYFIAVTVKQPGCHQWWQTFSRLVPDKEYVERIENYPGTQNVRWKDHLPWFSPDPG